MLAYHRMPGVLARKKHSLLISVNLSMKTTKRIILVYNVLEDDNINYVPSQFTVYSLQHPHDHRNMQEYVRYSRRFCDRKRNTFILSR